jgi:hypothetical protein
VLEPDDLVSLEAAARTAERSTSTVRRWLASGALTRHEAPATAAGGPPRVLVSTRELLALLASSGQAPRPATHAPEAPATHSPRPATAAGAPPATVDEVALLRAELVAADLRAALAVARAELEAARALATAERDAADLARRATEAHLRDVLDALEHERARVAGLEAEATALRGVSGVSWWRRLLG